ncbi:MAG: outer membrane beta-barrel protein [Bacteroidota bacterium]
MDRIVIFEKKFVRTTFSYIIFLCFTLSLAAQDQDVDVMSRHRPGVLWYYAGVKPPIPERVRRYDRLVFDVVYNDWMSKTVKPFKVSPLSIGFNVNMMFDVPLTKNNTTSLGFGFAYGLYRIRMNDFFARNDVNQSTELIPDVEQYGVEKSVFKANSVSIPLELRFKGAKWKHVKIHLGGRASYYFLPSTTLSSQTDDKVISKQKTVGFYDFNHFNASGHIRFGIRNWGLYASYNFMPLFKDAQSTRLNTFQFGVSVSLF